MTDRIANQERIQKIYMLVNAIKAGKQKDYIFMRDVTKETDGTEDWTRAAEIYNELFGEKADFINMCIWDMGSAIALN